MSTRKILLSTFAVVLLSAPFVVAANAATAASARGARHAAATHHRMVRPVHAVRHAGAHARTTPASRDSGDSAVDALNAQSLARARGQGQ